MRPPNLLFIFTDEQRHDAMGCAGNAHLRTPHLDRFAQTATRFTQAHCTQPVCTPSRSSIMSGLYPHATGAFENNQPLRDDVRTLPELLPEAVRNQYATGYFGKWHLGDEIFAQHGFDDWRGFEDEYWRHYSAGRDRDAVSPYSRWLSERGFKPDLPHGRFSRGRSCVLPERYTKPAWLADQACEFIAEHRDRPWILYLNFLEPHMPFFGPRTGHYDPATIPLPENYQHPPHAHHHLKPRLLYERFREEGFQWYDLGAEQGWRQMRAAYYGLCELVDAHVGRILDALDASGGGDQTAVVYTSDHGEMLGSHQLLGKSVMYQEAIRVPLLIRAPGQSKCGEVAGPVSQIDLVPTLLELLGQDVPAALHVESRASVVEGGGDVDGDVFIQWNAESAAESQVEDAPWVRRVTPDMDRAATAMRENLRVIVTDNGWRFTVSPELGQHELFDLTMDPMEIRNFAHPDHRRPEDEARMRDLCGRIRAWQTRVGDEVELLRGPGGDGVAFGRRISHRSTRMNAERIGDR